ncbi:MAG: helix-turn-helix domain-containing protein [Gammaproteobacteria bacterium]|nr:helix-turn-helix domain-containing protein [Gammaproteobacteria bacterium]
MNEKEAANYLGMSCSFLQHARCVGARQIGPNFLRFGRMIRYRQSDLESWLLQHRVEHGWHVKSDEAR